MRPIAKHERFAQLLADGLPQHEAYVKAGFKAKTNATARSAASNLLKRNVSIGERVDALLAERREIHDRATVAAVKTIELTKEWLLRELVEVVQMGKAAMPVYNGKGEPTGVYQQNLAAANRAIELLGREFGLFTEKKEIRTGLLDDLTHEDKKRVRDAILEARGLISRAAGRRASRVAD